jgi:hypothetical protein
MTQATRSVLSLLKARKGAIDFIDVDAGVVETALAQARDRKPRSGNSREVRP